MGKRLFFVLPVLFIFSLLFVQVSEAGLIDNTEPGIATQYPDPGTYTATVTKIGFYSTIDQNEPDASTIINLPSPQIVHEQWGGETNPNYNEFIYLGNIPNGAFVAIGLYAESSTIYQWDNNSWYPIGFDNIDGIAHTFTDSSRVKITVIEILEKYATVENL